MAAVDRLDTKPARKEKPKHSRLLRVAVVLPVVLICMIVYDVFIGPKGFDISHTDDGQQRIVSNVTQAPVILGESYARIEQGRMISNDIDEVKSFLGYHPPVPYRLSDEWHLSEIVASSNELWDVLIVNYEKNGATELLVYNYTRFYASQRVEQFTEQDKEGESMNTPNGLTVYVTQNVDSTIGAWETDNEAYYINGPISVDEILSVIDEITNAGG